MTREEAIKILKIKRDCMDHEGLSCSMDLKFKIDGEWGCDLCDKAIDMAIKALQERPKGRWIYEEHLFGKVRVSRLRCSNCRKTESCKSDYCPNCGSDNRESEE